MPERVTKEERMISLAIEKARIAKEMLQEESMHERFPLEDTSEEVKVKKPKAQDSSKIKNQTRKDEGFGLAGEMTDNS